MKNSMDDLLRDALGRRDPPPTACLDAETAAAFADDTLAAHERSSIEAHVADCARCQSLLAVLISTMPPTAPRVWWRRPAIAWLAPIAVAATALLVWVNIPRSMRSTNIEPATHMARQEAPVPQAPPAAADAAEKRQPELLRERASSQASVASPPAKQERESAEPRTAVPSRRAFADNRVVAAAPEVADAAKPAVAVPPASAPARAEEKAAVQEALSAQAGAAARGVRGRTMTQLVQARQDAVIVSLDQKSRWRIMTGGEVQHSGDGGATWQTQPTGADVTFTAGSSPSAAVCWLVGPAGLVVVTTDEGRSWQRLPFPEAVDLISIRASDDNVALVMAADGRTFTTADRGKNWSR
jgi:Photosynthesis system II assembly factor YCF48